MMQHAKTGSLRQFAIGISIGVLTLLTVAAHAQTAGIPMIPMANDLTESELSKLFNNGEKIPRFSTRNAKELQAKCQNAIWQEPAAPDAQSREWYRAATTLNAILSKTPEQYLQMLTLYEAAARKGHYRAVMQLTIPASHAPRHQLHLHRQPVLPICQARAAHQVLAAQAARRWAQGHALHPDGHLQT